MTETGEESRSSAKTAGASVSDGGPGTGAPALAGSDSGTDAERPRKRRRRKRRRGRKASGETAKQQSGTAAGKSSEAGSAGKQARPSPVYAAIDLGTNNCRLLVARRTRDGFRVIDAYSRIVRLGEGLAHTGSLSADAMDRALEALKVCGEKMQRRGVTRARSIATEACRTAENGAAFVERVKRETGIELDIVSTADEAQLAVAGCAPLLGPDHKAALVFDIGGGSTELMWVHHNMGPKPEIRDWTSLPCGVVTLAETYGGDEVSRDLFEKMVADVAERLSDFRARLAAVDEPVRQFHLLGTSGTVTTIAGVHLGLERYDRSRVDGAWVDRADVAAVTDALLDMTLTERAAHPCVGGERADLVLAGCAILEAISRAWPTDRLRVADRGLREGILFSLMEADERRTRRRRRRRRRKARPKNSGNPETRTPESGETP